jgi:hypothetical protein
MRVKLGKLLAEALSMFRCEYCDTLFNEHSPNCPNCGAQLRMNTGASKPEQAWQSIRAICMKYEGDEKLHFDDTINEKRLKSAREHFKIPASEKVLMIYDDTLFGSNKLGFAVCESGLYWKNDWSVPTKRTFLPWGEFGEREIRLSEDKFKIELGRGDNIGVAGAGDDNLCTQMTAMLSEIREAVK